MCSLTPHILPIAPISISISILYYYWLKPSALICPAKFYVTRNLQVYSVKAFSSLALFFIMLWEMFLFSGYKESVEKKLDPVREQSPFYTYIYSSWIRFNVWLRQRILSNTECDYSRA